MDYDSGRFISSDPVEDGFNWYTYCENDPINYIDPMGLSKEDRERRREEREQRREERRRDREERRQQRKENWEKTKEKWKESWEDWLKEGNIEEAIKELVTVP